MEINTKEIDVKNDSMLSKANALIVNDDEGLIVAGKFLTGIKAHVKNIRATFAPSKKKTDEAHKEVVALEKLALGFSGEVEMIVKGKISDHATKQEAIEKARAAKLAAELKAKAEKDALDLAEDLEKNSQAAEADLALEVAAAPVHVAPVKAVKVAGISYRDKYFFEVVSEGEVPAQFKKVDDARIRKHLAAKEALGEDVQIPGVRIWKKKIVAARA